MKFEKKAVIFDLDGVICFTDKFHYQAWKALADRLGIYFIEFIYLKIVRNTSRMIANHPGRSYQSQLVTPVTNRSLGFFPTLGMLRKSTFSIMG